MAARIASAELVPVAVYDAAWWLVVANAPYDALMGETSKLRRNERNGVWRNLDTLVVADDDLRIMVYTAEPSGEDADRLDLAIVLGTQTLVEEISTPECPGAGPGR